MSQPSSRHGREQRSFLPSELMRILVPSVQVGAGAGESRCCILDLLRGLTSIPQEWLASSQELRPASFVRPPQCCLPSPQGYSGLLWDQPTMVRLIELPPTDLSLSAWSIQNGLGRCLGRASEAVRDGPGQGKWHCWWLCRYDRRSHQYVEDHVFV